MLFRSLTSGETLASLLDARDNRIGALLATSGSDAEMLEELYWSTVTRAPSAKERDAMLAHLAGHRGEDKRKALQDIAWALINSKEFMFRH